MATKTEALKRKEDVRGKLTDHEVDLLAELFTRYKHKGGHRAVARRLKKR